MKYSFPRKPKIFLGPGEYLKKMNKEDKIIKVKNINIIGTKLIAIKKTSFLSLKFNLNLIFLTKNIIKIKKGTIVPICLTIKVKGNEIWSRIFDCSKPVRPKP